MEIGISLGDMTGIGPEVTLKALAAELPQDDTRYVLIGDVARTRALNESLRTGVNLETPGRIRFLNPIKVPLQDSLKPGAPEAALAAWEWVRTGAQLCLGGELRALVTAPVNKAAIVAAGKKFVGQTELLSELAGT